MDSLHHVAIQVKDLSRALQWYTSQFDCRVLYQDDTWAFLEFANIRLALVIPSQHPAHIAIQQDHVTGFGPLKHHRDGTRSVYVTDSEGNAVELIEAPHDF